MLKTIKLSADSYHVLFQYKESLQQTLFIVNLLRLNSWYQHTTFNAQSFFFVSNVYYSYNELHL